MVCFNSMRSNLIVRILAVFQLMIQVASTTVGVFGLLGAWQDRSNESGDNPDGHHCECVLKQRPLTCELIDVPGPKQPVNRWDPMFVILCFWVVCLSVLATLRDLRFGASRLMNSGLFLLTGSILVGLGDHYDMDELLYVGYVASAFCAILLLSVPICGRYRTVEGFDEESRLTDNDEFGQAHGVFSSLND